MSRENVELVRRSVGAFNSGDWDGALEYMDEGIEWRPPFVVPDQDTYVGRDGVRAAHVARLRNGKIRRWAMYASAQEALEAVGLSE